MSQAITDGDGLLVLSNLPKVLCTVLYAQYSALSPCNKTAITGRPFGLILRTKPRPAWWLFNPENRGGDAPS